MSRRDQMLQRAMPRGLDELSLEKAPRGNDVSDGRPTLSR
jgi:hypothetical protein